MLSSLNPCIILGVLDVMTERENYKFASIRHSFKVRAVCNKSVQLRNLCGLKGLQQERFELNNYIS